MNYKIFLVTLTIFLSIAVFVSCDTRDENEDRVTLTLEAIPDSTYADYEETDCELIATLIDEEEGPLFYERVCFSVDFVSTDDSLGVILPECKRTDKEGLAEVRFWTRIKVPIKFPIYADITASWENLSATTRIKILPLPKSE